VLAPGGLLRDPFSTVSLAMALFFGTVGLPHVLMRLFTVPDARAAYRSIFFSSMFIGLIFLIVFFILGFGAISLLYAHPDLFDAQGRLIGGSNMVTVHLSRIVAGDVFLGFISGVVFATILAVVAGLSITGAATFSHDLYANVFRNGHATEKEELRVSRITALVLGVLSILLAILFERQNIAYMISLVFVVTASANCPILFGVLFWRGLTTRGALLGGGAGLVLAVGLVVLGPTVWVEILGNKKAIFPSKYPGLTSVTAGFFFTWLGSMMDRSAQGRRDRERFTELYRQIHTATAQ
jgi:cation/acetate symporter